MEDEIEQLDQINSELSSTATINSITSAVSQISSDMQSVLPILYVYNGIENDLIKVNVDNTNKTIEAISKTFVFEQSTPNNVWEIEHNLNKYPNVIVVDELGEEVEADIIYDSLNKVVIEFSVDFSGKAFLN